MTNPLFGKLLRAGGGVLLVFVVEVVSLFPNMRIEVGQYRFALPFFGWISGALRTFAPPSSLTGDAINLISAAFPEYAVDFLLSLGVLLLAKFLTKKPILLGEWNVSSAPWILFIVFCGWSLYLLSRGWDVLSGHLSWEEIWNPSCHGLIETAATVHFFGLFFLLLLFGTLVAPVVEEILYRGLLFNALMPAFGLLPSAVISSSLFSLSHWGVAVDLVDYVRYFIIGMLLFAARRKFGGIGVPIFAHVVMNASFSFASLFRCDFG